MTARTDSGFAATRTLAAADGSPPQSAPRVAPTPPPPALAQAGRPVPLAATSASRLLPRNSGFRFSLNAFGPSRASLLANTAAPSFASTGNASSSAMPSVSRIVRRIACTASGPFAAIAVASSRAFGSA